MSTNTAESTTSDATPEQSEGTGADVGHSNFWPDETVDAICALIVISTLTLGVLFFVMNG